MEREWVGMFYICLYSVEQRLKEEMDNFIK